MQFMLKWMDTDFSGDMNNMAQCFVKDSRGGPTCKMQLHFLSHLSKTRLF